MGYSPPTKTLGDVFTYIKRQFGDEAGVQVVLSDVIRWVNAAEAEIISSNNVLTAKATTNTVTGQEAYTLAPVIPIQTINSIQVTGTKIPFRNFNEAEAYITSNDPNKVNRGFPLFWYEWAGDLYLYPLPDQAYTMVVFYHKIAAPLSDESSVLNVPDNYFNRVLEYCMGQAYELDENFEASQMKMQQFDSKLVSMNLDEARPSVDVYPTITVLADDL